MRAKPSRKSKSSVGGQILVRYHRSDTVAGVSRKTATRLAKMLGLTETQAIHLALARLARETLSRYEPDDSPFTAKQLNVLKRLEPQDRIVVKEKLFS